MEVTKIGTVDKISFTLKKNLQMTFSESGRTSRMNNDLFHKKVKEEKKITPEDINQILVDLINRTRFKYTTEMILDYLTKCLCCRKKSFLRGSIENKKHFLFEKAK